jgi:hypothetical protein
VAASIVLKKKKETKAEYHVRDILYSLRPMTLIFSIESCDSVYRLISSIIYDLILKIMCCIVFATVFRIQ